jgi:hypothetical protein
METPNPPINALDLAAMDIRPSVECPTCEGQGKLDAGGGSECWCDRCCGTGKYMDENEAQQRWEALTNPS